MLKERRQLFMTLFVTADLAVLGLAWAMSYLVRFVVPLIPVTKGTPPVVNYLTLLPVTSSSDASGT